MRDVVTHRPSERDVPEMIDEKAGIRDNILSVLLRDVLPTLFILIFFTVCSSVVATKMERAKLSRTLNIMENGVHR